jgi:hypothetical protein
VFPPDFALIAIAFVILRVVSTTYKLEHHVRHRLHLLSLFCALARLATRFADLIKAGPLQWWTGMSERDGHFVL